jgi:copper homeostasis protein
MSRVLFESCVDSVEAAIASADAGADRLEFCAALDVGGTTPDPALIARTVAVAGIPIVAMARPRPGSFEYSTAEVDALERDVLAMKAAGAHGIAIGALSASGDVDVAAMRRLIDAARPMTVTFHRAFDEARDLNAALDVLVALGVDRVLTSGGAPTAAQGAATLGRLMQRAAGRLAIVAAGHVRPANVAALVAASGVADVHARLIIGPCATAADRAAASAAVGAMVSALSRPR